MNVSTHYLSLKYSDTKSPIQFLGALCGEQHAFKFSLESRQVTCSTCYNLLILKATHSPDIPEDIHNEPTQTQLDIDDSLDIALGRLC